MVLFPVMSGTEGTVLLPAVSGAEGIVLLPAVSGAEGAVLLSAVSGTEGVVLLSGCSGSAGISLVEVPGSAVEASADTGLAISGSDSVFEPSMVKSPRSIFSEGSFTKHPASTLPLP